MHTVVAEHLDLTRDSEQELFQMDGDSEQELIVDTNGLHHVFKEIRNETRASAGLRLVQDRSQGGVCSSFTENENEVYEEKRRELSVVGSQTIPV